MRLMQLGSFIIPLGNIREIRPEVLVPGSQYPALDIYLFDMQDAFRLTGNDVAGAASDDLGDFEPYAARAEFMAFVSGQMVKRFITIDSQEIDIATILWADLQAQIEVDGQMVDGVELATITDEPGFTTKYTGDLAKEAYATLTNVTENCSAMRLRDTMSARFA